MSAAISTAISAEEALDKMKVRLRQHFPCGQATDDPKNPCNEIWKPYGRRCPECPLHPGEVEDVARDLLSDVFPELKTS